MKSPLPIRCLGIAVALLAAAGCATPEKAPIPTSPVSVTGQDWRATDHVIVITDASGTMWAEKTFPDAKALTRSFIGALPAQNARAANPGTYNAGLIGFGGEDRAGVALSSFSRGQLASSAQKLEVMGDISGMGGTTPYAAVLTESARMLKGKRGRAALVIFSDGVPDSDQGAMIAGQRLVKGYPDVCIHGVHTGDDPEGYAFLKRLSSLTQCGSVREASAIGSGAEVQMFAKNVMVTPGVLPPVAAAPGPCAGVIRLRGIEFAFNKAAIKDDSKPVLDVAVEQLSRCPDIKITISGYTDSIGPAEYNMNLSNRRADATRSYLVQSGISAGRLDTEGFGENDPIASNDTPAGRAQNRRVELSPTR